MQTTKNIDSLIRGFSAIGNKWKVLIIYVLAEGSLRFTILNHRIPSITHRSLSRELKDLESDGVITRTAYMQIPPRVEYQLTSKGRSLLDIIYRIADWGERTSRTHTPLSYTPFDARMRLLLDHRSINEHSSPWQSK